LELCNRGGPAPRDTARTTIEPYVSDRERERTKLAEFLARSGNVSAIETLTRDYRREASGVRIALIVLFDKAKFTHISVQGRDPDPVGRTAAESQRLRTALLDLLVAALDDTTPTGLAGNQAIGPPSYEPRFCDFAAQMLHELAPEQLPFDLAAPVSQRNAEIVHLKNLRRKEQGLPALPVPRLKPVVPITDDVLAPLVDGLFTAAEAQPAGAPQAGNQAEIVAKLDQLGPAVVPGLLKRRGPAPQDNAAPQDKRRHAILEVAARRASTIVTVVEFEPASLKSDQTPANKLRSHFRKPLDPAAFAKTLVEAAEGLSGPAAGLSVNLVRDQVGGGIVVRIDVLDAARAKKAYDETHDSEQLTDLLYAPSALEASSEAPKATANLPRRWRHLAVAAVGPAVEGASIGGSPRLDAAKLEKVLQVLADAPPEAFLDARFQLIGSRL
jgi:hypothetical protein